MVTCKLKLIVSSSSKTRILEFWENNYPKLIIQWRTVLEGGGFWKEEEGKRRGKKEGATCMNEGEYSGRKEGKENSGRLTVVKRKELPV